MIESAQIKIEILKAIEEGDVSAFVDYADILYEENHPDAEELSSLAVDICYGEDALVQQVATMVYLEIIKKHKGKLTTSRSVVE